MADAIDTTASSAATADTSTTTATTTSTRKSGGYERPEHVLQRFSLALTNAKNPDVQAAISPYNYTTERIDEGLLFLENVRNLTAAQRRERGEQLDASGVMNTTFVKARDMFVITRSIARQIFRNDSGAYAGLGLAGNTRLTISGLSKQADMFYTNLLGKEPFIAEMSYFGYTKEKLESEKKIILELMAADADHKKELGEALDATVVRDEAFEALDEWMSRFFTVAKAALKKKPDLQRSLGM